MQMKKPFLYYSIKKESENLHEHATRKNTEILAIKINEAPYIVNRCHAMTDFQRNVRVCKLRDKHVHTCIEIENTNLQFTLPRLRAYSCISYYK